MLGEIEMALISVIMGVYNCKDISLLYKSINSIIDQTFGDWEFIICDDGSSDNTLDELKKIEKLDSRIKIISYEENHGLAYALNECIKIAQGEYIARQDDDDISKPNRFEKQLEILRRNKKISIVGCNAEVFDDSGVWGEYTVEENPTVKTFLWTNPFAHPTVMMRTCALKESGCYRVVKATRRCEDYDLFMRMYAHGYIGYNIQDKLYEYRIVNGSKKYRPMKYRLDEAVIRWYGYGLLRINIIFRVMFTMKPILIGLIPQKIFKVIRRSQY